MLTLAVKQPVHSDKVNFDSLTDCTLLRSQWQWLHGMKYLAFDQHMLQPSAFTASCLAVIIDIQRRQLAL